MSTGKKFGRKDWAKGYANQRELADHRTGSGRGVFGVERAAPVPKRAHVPITQAFTEKYALQKEIAVWGGVGNDAESHDVQGFIYTPSNRLILTLQVIFESQDMLNIDPAFVTPPTWTITRMGVNSISGRETALSQFYPSVGTANLPDEVIVPDAPELLRANIHFIDFPFTPAYGGNGVKMYLQAKWEPDVQTIPVDELKRLYDRCRISYGQPVKVLIPS